LPAFPKPLAWLYGNAWLGLAMFLPKVMGHPNPQLS